jgi:hypothetical protein
MANGTQQSASPITQVIAEFPITGSNDLPITGSTDHPMFSTFQLPDYSIFNLYSDYPITQFSISNQISRSPDLQIS